jgi:hypothetical protein
LGSGEKIKWAKGMPGIVFDPPAKASALPVVYKVLLKGFAMGKSEIQTKGNQFTVGGFFQNYDENEIVEKVDLTVNEKQILSQQVTVGGRTTKNFEFSNEIPLAGLYQVGLISQSQPDSPKVSFLWQVAIPSIDLTGEWLFSKGDAPYWMKPGLDDSAWEKVKLPCKWEDHGYKCEYCYGWYRLHLVIPKEWKGHSLVLPLGKIDDTDITYFNGKEIGRMGDMKTTAWDKERRYEVSANLIHYGKDNVIAIRVYNMAGGAGLYDGPLGPIEVK